ncbi:hypothetical protein B9K06_15360 [Bacillus sp. OG2]|uniref:Uncharacterized protein n=1 Tax=Bacillus infantis NRRL B-14911 TaxID=1367477 RepID=U5LA80_9BACI|nr:hypothetical protein N288_08640 [Bacillus infantis NRRL B-14911]OXT16524.1 hypothetical protein B9K06_15360 [Bacillus sp. OG2]
MIIYIFFKAGPSFYPAFRKQAMPDQETAPVLFLSWLAKVIPAVLNLAICLLRGVLTSCLAGSNN